MRDIKVDDAVMQEGSPAANAGALVPVDAGLGRRMQLHAICKYLNIVGRPMDLPFVPVGDQMEIQTLTAAIEEIKVKYSDRMAGMCIVAPATAAVLAGPGGGPDHEWEGFLEEVQGCTRVLIPVWSAHPKPYTYIEARRNNVESAWESMHYDSLPKVARTARQAAVRIVAGLGLGPLGGSVEEGRQKDGWSCGLWVLRKLESAVTGQVLLANLKQQAAQVNRFVAELRQVADGNWRLRKKSSIPVRPSQADNAGSCQECGCWLFPPHGACLNPECGRRFEEQCPVLQKPASANAAATQGVICRSTAASDDATLRKRRGSSSPYPFSNAYSYQPLGGAKVAKTGQNFKKLDPDEPTVGEIAQMTEQQAQVCLQKYGLLPPLPPKFCRLCWKCKKSVRLAKRKGRAVELKCRKRCGMKVQALTAFSPMYNREVTFRDYLQLCRAYALQYRIDQTAEDMKRTMNYKKVHRIVQAFRDVTAWFSMAASKGVTFSSAEVDVDCAKMHVDRSQSETTNTHKGRSLLFKERGSGKKKLYLLGSVTVEKGSAPPPESNEDVAQPIADSVKAGAVVGADGGQAVRSSLKKAHGDNVPLVTAIHGKNPKQFTRFQKLAVATLPPQLKDVLEKQGRIVERSQNVRLTGGNQGAEGEWGTSKSYLKQLCLHRGPSHKHSSAHAAATMFLAHNPGLRAFGHVWRAWFGSFCDVGSPLQTFDEHGWRGNGLVEDGSGITQITKRTEPKEPKPSPGNKISRKRPAAALMDD